MRLDFVPQGVCDDAVLAEHVRFATESGVPFIEMAEPHTTKLAVVGGGFSSKERLKELVDWDGHIWAINQGATWLAENGRTKDVWLFSVSPTERIATYLQGVERAILSTNCNPVLFRALAGKDVRIFNLGPECGPASVGNTILPAAILGYTDITFFGCEGQIGETSHLYRHDPNPDQIVVRVAELDYITTPDLYVITQHLAGVIREYPEAMKERSGGMLRGMVEHPDEWEVVAVSDTLRRKVYGDAVAETLETFTPKKPPFRLLFNGIGICTEDVCIAQAKQNIAAGVPMLEQREPHDTPLAIVGGGPSAKRALAELVNFQGDIWGINQSASWLISEGRHWGVWMFTVDPDHLMAVPEMVAGVRAAILGSSVHPKVFEMLRAQGADVRMFHTREIYHGDTVLGGGPCSAARAILQAAFLGYKKVTFYGCEGSHSDGNTHAYRHETRPNQMVIRAGGVDYITTPDLYINTQYLAQEIAQYPFGLFEKSGGLLRAMLKHPNSWEVVALSEGLKKTLDPTSVTAYIPQLEAA